MSSSIKLARRLKELAEKWPVDTGKGKNDFGLYIRRRVDALKDQDCKNLHECQQQVEALHLIRNNHFKKKFLRKNETSFTGIQLDNTGKSILSEDIKEKLLKRTFWDKFLGRKRSYFID
eukprot:m.22374 g.22374  ORF g.22374 m.22374 type:complete len:119 (+) comp28338_c0_seq1:17-373(+)